jgi:hypothetical protein
MACRNYDNESECVANGCHWVAVHGVCNTGSECSIYPKATCLFSNCFWYDESCHCDPCPLPEGIGTQEDCVNAGCFWYDGTCHSNPPVNCGDLIEFNECDACGCYWWDDGCHSIPNPHPGDDRYMIFISPSYDYADQLVNGWVDTVLIPYAQAKKFWTVISILDDQVSNEIVHPTMRQFDPKGVCEHGHGTTNSISGHGPYAIWALWGDGPEYLPELAGKIIYFFSCYNGAELGPAIVNDYGGRAFLGFDDETWLGSSTGYKETFCEPWKALMDGADVGTAVQRMIDKFNYWIDYYLSIGQSSVASHLIFNRDHLVWVGDMSAKLVENRVVDDTANITIQVQ